MCHGGGGTTDISSVHVGGGGVVEVCLTSVDRVFPSFDEGVLSLGTNSLSSISYGPDEMRGASEGQVLDHYHPSYYYGKDLDHFTFQNCHQTYHHRVVYRQGFTVDSTGEVFDLRF